MSASSMADASSFRCLPFLPATGLALRVMASYSYGRKAQSCHVPVVLEQAPDVEILAVQDVHKLLSDAERVRPRPPLQFGVGKQIKVSERDGAVALQMLEQISRSLR